MPSSIPHSASSHKLALLIDSDPVVREDVAHILRARDYESVCYPSVGEAARAFSPPALIVIKSDFGDADALEFVEWARKKCADQQPYVISLVNANPRQYGRGVAVLWNQAIPSNDYAARLDDAIHRANEWCSRIQRIGRREEAHGSPTSTFLKQTGLKRAPSGTQAAGAAGGFGEGKRTTRTAVPVAAAATQTATNSPFRPAGPPRKAFPAQTAAVAALEEANLGSTETRPAGPRPSIPNERDHPEMAPTIAPIVKGASPPILQKTPAQPAPVPDPSALRMRQLLDHLPMAVALFDTDMHYLAANRRWLSDFGLENSDLVGRSHYEVFPDLHENWKYVYAKAQSGETQCSDENFSEDADGTQSWVRWEASPWKDAEGALGGILISCQTISHQQDQSQKATPDAADAQETAAPLLDELVQILDAPAVIVNPSGTITVANRALSSTLGCKEVVGQPLWKIAGKANEKSLREGFEALAAEGSLNIGKRLDVLLPANATLPARCIRWAALPSIDTDDNLLGIALVGSMFEEQEPDVLPSTEPLEKWIGELEAELEKTRQAHRASTEEVDLIQSQSRQFESQLSESLSNIELLQGELEAARNSTGNIEEALAGVRAAEAVPNEALETIDSGVIILDSSANVIHSNAFADALLGFSVASAGGVEGWLAKGCPEEAHRAEVLKAWWERIWPDQTNKVVSLSDSSGVIRDVELRLKPISKGNLSLVCIDVTDQRRTEDALRNSEARFRMVFQECGTGVAIVDRSGAILNINPALEKVLGSTQTEMRRRPLDEIVDPGYLGTKQALDEALHQTGQGEAPIHETELKIIGADGTPVPVTIRAAIVQNHAGKKLLTAYFIQTRDEEMQPALKNGESEVAEQPANRAEQNLQTGLLEAVPAPMVIADREGIVLDCNVAAEVFFDKGIDELAGVTLGYAFNADSDEFGDTLLTALHTKGGHEQTCTLKGSDIECSVRFFPVLDENSELASIIALVDEPAETEVGLENPGDSEAADQARANVDARECLHNMKNHLQILVSLQNLQLRQASGTSDRALVTTSGRLNTVAHVYQHVGMDGSSLERVSFSNAGDSIMQSLERAWCERRPGTEIRWRFDELDLETNRAVPLALILGELVTNAYEHGHHDGTASEIQVRLAIKPKKNVGVLIVANNGGKMPKGTGSKPGLGLAIAETLAEQIGGTFRPDPERKPEFRVVFPLKPGIDEPT